MSKRIIAEESEEESEDEQIEELGSELEVSLQNAEDSLAKIETDIQRLRKMDEKLNDILKSRLYTRVEKKAFENSYDKIRNNMQGSVEAIVNIINEAKGLWKQKQAAMAEVHQEDLLDTDVAKVWDESLRTMADRIEKLQKSLAFYHQESTPEEEEPVRSKSKHRASRKESSERRRSSRRH